MLLFLCCLVISPSPASAAAGGSKRVLMLYSYGRNFAAFSAVGSSFQTELAEHSRVPIQFHEVSLPGPLFEPSELEQPTLNYVQGLFGGSEPDLIVPVGGPAVRYALRFRQQLFPSAPLLLAGVEARHLKTFTLDTNTTTVAMTVDFPGLVEHARRILPGTTNFAVVLGRSRLEVFWKQQLQREFTVFTNQVEFTWLDQYSLTEMQEQVGRLPPHSAIFYVTLLVDASGVPYEADKAIKALYAAANAPMVGLGDQGLGLGSVGGPVRDPRALGQEAARVATRILNGEPPGDIHVPPMTPVYDWRELRRWNISEDRLPPGSVVKFREPSIWERHRTTLIAGLSLLVVQSALIASLVLNLRRRRRAERSLLESEGRMKLAASAAELGMWEWDIATNRLWMDERARGKIGTTDGESDYSHFWRAVHPDDRPDVREALAKAINGDGSYESVYRRALADGKVTWISARGRVEFDAAHKPVRMRGVGMDITARRLAEDRARESEQRFLLIANSSPVMMWTTTTDKSCDFVNERWLKFRGRRLEQELGNGWAEGIHSEDRADALRTYTEAFEARQPFTMEYRLLRHDGEYRWISDHGVPRYDTDKKFLGYVGTCVDVTEKKETEQAAQRLQQEWRM